MLHYVSDDTSLDSLKPYVISKASFDRLLDYIEDNGYSTIVFEDVQSGNIPEKSIMLTFDDCVKELWDYAIPELKRRNMKAVFYAATAYLGSYDKWNKGGPDMHVMFANDMMRLVEMGMEVGAHSHEHIFLDRVRDTEVMEQITTCKKLLERIIRKPVISLAYPYGGIPKNYKKLVTAAGYDYGISVYSVWQNKYTIRRWIYSDKDDAASIARKLSPGYRFNRTFSDKAYYFKTKVLPWMYKRYATVKKWIRNIFFLKMGSVGVEILDIDLFVNDYCSAMIL